VVAEFGTYCIGAKLFAIYKAMQLATTDISLQDKLVLIFTDSRAALQLLSSASGGSYCLIVVKIHQLMQSTELDRVLMCWIQEYNIHRNEVADRVANFALSNNHSCKIPFVF
jgi:hypothetical protein